MNERARRYRYIASTDMIYEVNSQVTGTEYIVNLVNWTCSCREWQLQGYPCAHTLTVLLGRKFDINHYIQPFYFLTAYRQTYSGIIVHPAFVPSDEPLEFAHNPLLQQLEPPDALAHDFSDSEEGAYDDVEGLDDKMLPPNTRRPPGLPKKRRIRHGVERETTRIQKCTHCREVGHSRRTCKTAI